MNPTIIKEIWHGSWEVRLVIIATFIATLTGNDIAPYILWMPEMIQGFVAQYWSILALALAGWLRLTKTSTKLVLSQKDADPPEVVAAAKAALSPPSAAQVAAAAATLKAFEDSQKSQDPKV